MILSRLHELAEREGLLDDLAFERHPIPYIISLGPEGKYLGIQQRRGTITSPARKKGGEAKTRPDKGTVLDVPRPHGNPATRGFARFFADTLARVLPVDDEQKSALSRATFWRQIDQAVEETDDPALRAVQTFGRNLADPELIERIRAEVEANKPAPGDRCTFAWHTDEGGTIVEREPLRDWYRQFFEKVAAERSSADPRGICQVTGQVQPLPGSHPKLAARIPGQTAAELRVISNDKAAFESYNLDGAANSAVGQRAAEGYVRALDALMADQLPGRPKTSLRLGPVLFLFWTREKAGGHFLDQLDQPQPEHVAKLIQSVKSGRPSSAADPRDFYCLCLSGNGARAIVRDYLELPLAAARENLGRWFDNLQIIDAYTGETAHPVPLWQLVGATVRRGDDPAPDLPALLMSAALKGTALPDHILAACLRRIRVEAGDNPFHPARVGLIKLILNRAKREGDLQMSEQLDSCAADRSAGYASGRLLACLARCQSPRDYGSGAQVLERYFGSASTAPRSVFPVLLRLNRHHIRKIRDENTGFAVNLEKELEERLAPFRGSSEQDPDFPAVLSLTEQGRFALGFYHQRAEYRADSIERKRNQNETNE